ncbi:hypothetical protein [Streptomyces luteireticuli]|uniref:hypothetical protein n=1 Tax=Streptomyces luteireticuli TaxID=173858 RepID=UPI003555F7A1
MLTLANVLPSGVYEVRLIDEYGYTVATNYRVPGPQVESTRAAFLRNDAAKHYAQWRNHGYRQGLRGYRVQIFDVTAFMPRA